MRFKKISLEMARQNLNGFIKNHYIWKYKDLKKFIKLKINKELFNKIKKKGLSKKEMERLCSNIKNRDTEKEMEAIKKAWKSNSKKIMAVANKITGMKIKDKDFTCYVDPYTNLGFYSKKDISVSSNLRGQAVNFVIFHELFHIYYWKLIDKLRLKADKDKTWKLSELVIYLLQKDKKMNIFWKKEKIYLYPGTKALYLKVKKLWKKQNFSEFLVNSYNILR